MRVSKPGRGAPTGAGNRLARAVLRAREPRGDISRRIVKPASRGDKRPADTHEPHRRAGPVGFDVHKAPTPGTAKGAVTGQRGIPVPGQGPRAGWQAGSAVGGARQRREAMHQLPGLRRRLEAAEREPAGARAVRKAASRRTTPRTTAAPRRLCRRNEQLLPAVRWRAGVRGTSAHGGPTLPAGTCLACSGSPGRPARS